MYVKDVPVCVAPKFADDLVSVAVGDDMKSVMDQLQNSADQCHGQSATIWNLTFPKLR